MISDNDKIDDTISQESQEDNENIEQTTTLQSETDSAFKLEKKSIELSGYYPDKKTIEINNDEFLDWINEIFTNMDTFDGWTVIITGQVYKGQNEGLKDNEFIPARLVMTCCIADLVPCGIICRYDKVSELSQDSWVTVTGKIFKGEYEGNSEAQLNVISIHPVQAVDGYLYP